MEKFDRAKLEVVKFENKIYTGWPDGDIVCGAMDVSSGQCPVEDDPGCFELEFGDLW